MTCAGFYALTGCLWRLSRDAVRQSSRIELIERRLAEVERRLGIGRS